MAKISVVMAVFNGAGAFPATMASILEQTERDLEVIVVDDGSTDDTPRLAAEVARTDPRVRVLTQANAGLTRALIRGCEEARAPVIARQDCGDRSHPERLAKQLAALEAGPDVVLVSCSTRYLAPGGEELYVVEGDGDEVRRSLREDSVETIRGLSHHGSAMFRRDDYVAAGGYRERFRVAQDLDLWVRMAARGRIAFVPEVLYEAIVEPGAISTRKRAEQIEAARVALALRDGKEVASAALPPPVSARRAEANTLYFIASCLRRRRDPHWRAYAGRALRRNPLLLRAWLLFVRPAR
ncbi:MAG TPA: glycosyltransferase family A protein [Thermoanaerobaculia bacterium]